MGNLIQTILKLLKSLFGGSTATDSHTTNQDCVIFDIEIPSEFDLNKIPHITIDSQAQSISAQAAAKACQIQIRPELGRVNLRGGPRLGFGPLAIADGGVFLDLVGASEADPDGYRWYNVLTESRINAWVRADTVIIGEDCLTFTFIHQSDLTPPPAPTATDRFVLPATAQINQGYSSSHRGLDLDTPIGTPIHAATTGIVIRSITCTACADSPHFNIYPCGTAIYNSAAWGYGYGNFVLVRHDYRVLPPPIQSFMASKNLEDGYAYILYAHLSERKVELGQPVIAGDLLGLTGNHGCSSAPHLHFEVRIGKDEIIDGHWLEQTPVNPNLVFNV